VSAEQCPTVDTTRRSIGYAYLMATQKKQHPRDRILEAALRGQSLNLPIRAAADALIDEILGTKDKEPKPEEPSGSGRQ
jgi:hypothetical protein